jgi:anti-sigma regulatory factor (Ser/Thr protein kinase)
MGATVLVCEREAHVRMPAVAEGVAAARHAVAELCSHLGLSRGRTADVELAVTEACANAVVHAYIEPTAAARLVEVDAELQGRRLVVVVRDYGRGISPRSDSPGLGLGLPLIAHVADELEFRSKPEAGATELVMSFEVRHLVVV